MQGFRESAYALLRVFATSGGEMTASANKTIQTDADVGAFLATVADDRQRTDAVALIDILKRLSGESARMWGPSIIGFGTYHYKYVSGREGDMARIGFSPRKGQTVLYIADGFPRHADIMARLGKYKTGKSCLYVKRLVDIDGGVLEELFAASLDFMAEKYPKDLA